LSACVASAVIHSSLQAFGDHSVRHSFPTRRSSDLKVAVGVPLAAVIDPALGALPLQHPALAALGADAAGVLHQALGALALGEARSEEHTSELQSRFELVCRLLLEKKKKNKNNT